jgi:hypothetical protein
VNDGVDPITFTAAHLGKAILGTAKGAVGLVAPDSAAYRGLDESIASVDDLLGADYKADRRAKQAEVDAQDSNTGKALVALRQAATDPGSIIQGIGYVAPAALLGAAGSVVGLGARGLAALQAAHGAIQGGGAVRGGMYDNVMNAKPEQLATSPTYNKYVVAYGETRAREMLAKDAAALENSGDMVALGALVGAVMGRTGLEASLTKAAVGAGVKATAKTVGKKVAVETVTESGQEGFESYAGNVGARRTGTDIKLDEGVAQAMGAAAPMGAVGGGIGARIEHVQAAMRKQADANSPDPVTAPGEPTPAQATALQDYRDALAGKTLPPEGVTQNEIIEQSLEALLDQYTDPAEGEAAAAKALGERDVSGDSTAPQAAGTAVSEADTTGADTSATGAAAAPAAATGVTATDLVAAVNGYPPAPSVRPAGADGSVGGVSEQGVTDGTDGVDTQQQPQPAADAGVRGPAGDAQAVGDGGSRGTSAREPGTAARQVDPTGTGDVAPAIEIAVDMVPAQIVAAPQPAPIRAEAIEGTPDTAVPDAADTATVPSVDITAGVPVQQATTQSAELQGVAQGIARRRLKRAYNAGALDAADEVRLQRMIDEGNTAQASAEMNRLARENLGGDARFLTTAEPTVRTTKDFSGSPDSDALKELERVLAKSFGITVAPGSALAAAPMKVSGQMKRLADALGVRVVMFQPKAGADAKFAGFNGVTVGGPLRNTIFINVASDRPHVQVLGHELVHEMARDFPDLYDALLDQMRPYVSEAQFQAFQTSPAAVGETNVDRILQEFAGEVMSDALTTPAFWAGLADANPSLFGRLWERLTALIDRITDRLPATEVMQGYTSDYQAIVAVAAKAMSDYRSARVEARALSGTDIRMQSQGIDRESNFKRWFGDSKVVDADGKPLVVYHGTSQSEGGGAFTAFDTYASNYGLMGQGGYFTADPEVAGSYTRKGKGDTPTVYPVYLSIKNAIDMDAKADTAAWKAQFEGIGEFHETGDTNESWYRAAEEMISAEWMPKYEGAKLLQDGLRAMGYDGVTHIGGGRVKGDSVRHRVYVAFDPEQIKSATGNRGTFDPNSPNITFLNRPVAANAPPLPTNVRYRQTATDKVIAAVADNADVMMRSLDATALRRDGGVDGPMVKLKLAFESAFYRARNQKQVFTEQLDKDIYAPLVKMVQLAADKAGAPVDEVMKFANNIAVARRVVEDSTAIFNDKLERESAYKEQEALIHAVTIHGNPQLKDTDLHDLNAVASALASAKSSGKFLSVADTNRLQANLLSAIAQIEAKLAGLRGLQGIDIPLALRRQAITDLHLQQGEAAGFARNKLQAIASDLAAMFDPEVPRADRRTAATSRLLQVQNDIAQWNRAQARTDHLTGTDVRLPAGMTIREASDLIAEAALQPYAADVTTIADKVRDSFAHINDFAVAKGVTSAASVQAALTRRPNYVSFASNPNADADSFMTHNHRAYMDIAEGSTSYMHGGNLNVFQTLNAKMLQAAHMASVHERNALALELARAGMPGLKYGVSPSTPRDSRLQVLDEHGRRVFIGLDRENYTQQAFIAARNEISDIAYTLARVTGGFGSLFTHWTPVFAPVNSVKDVMTRTVASMGRDFQRTAGIDMGSIETFVRISAMMVRNMASVDTARAALDHAAHKPLTGDLAGLQQHGGILTFSKGTSVRIKQLEDRFVKTGMLRATASMAASAVSAWNEYWQAGPSIAMYKTLRSLGATQEQAAAATLSQADFHRSGNTRIPRMIYTFFNPAAQDALVTARMLKDSRGNWNYGAMGVLVGVATVSAFLYALARARDAEDPVLKNGRKKMDNLPTMAVTTSMHVPLPSGGYAKLPIGFGMFGSAFALGVIQQRYADGLLSAKEAAMEGVRALLKPAFVTGEPMADISKEPLFAMAQIVTPDILQPMLNVLANKSSFGSQLAYGTRSDVAKAAQGSDRLPEIYKEAAKGLHKATGLDVAPEKLQELARGYFAGPLRFLTDRVTAQNEAEKGLTPTQNVPWWSKALGAGRVYSDPSAVADLHTAFYRDYDRARGTFVEYNSKIHGTNKAMLDGLSPAGKARWLVTKADMPESDVPAVSAALLFDDQKKRLDETMKYKAKAGRARDEWAFVGQKEAMKDNLMEVFLRSVHKVDEQ